jgi:hypothetical protein
MQRRDSDEAKKQLQFVQFHGEKYTGKIGI